MLENVLSAGFIAAVSAAVGGFLTWFLSYKKLKMDVGKQEAESRRELRKQEAEIRSTEFAEGAKHADNIINRLEGQINRMQVQITDQQGSINFMHEEYTDMLVESANIRGVLAVYQNIAQRMSRRLEELNEDVEILPSIPPPRARRDMDPGFLRRTSLQNQVITREITETLAHDKHDETSSESSGS